MSKEPHPRKISVDTAAECLCPTCGQEALKRLKVPGSEDGYSWVCQHCHHASTLSELRERCRLAR